jgi:hypothetical protein
MRGSSSGKMKIPVESAKGAAWSGKRTIKMQIPGEKHFYDAVQEGQP